MNDPQELIPFSRIGVGETFVIDRYPGNLYIRLNIKGEVEFLQHRSNPEYRGCRTRVSACRAVRRQPISQEEAELLGVPFNVEPFLPPPPNPAYALLDTDPVEDYSLLSDEDLLA